MMHFVCVRRISILLCQTALHCLEVVHCTKLLYSVFFISANHYGSSNSMGQIDIKDISMVLKIAIYHTVDLLGLHVFYITPPFELFFNIRCQFISRSVGPLSVVLTHLPLYFYIHT